MYTGKYFYLSEFWQDLCGKKTKTNNMVPILYLQNRICAISKIEFLNFLEEWITINNKIAKYGNIF